MGGFGFPPAEQLAYRAPEPDRAMFELRPLSTGEILDRTFALYRQRFWLYVGLSAVTASVTTLLTFAQISLGVVGRKAPSAADPAAMMKLGFTTMVVAFLGLAVHVLAYSITQAATVSAVEANYLGYETSIGAALKTVRGKWYRYVLVALWQGWSFAWPLLAIVFPAAIIAGLLSTLGGGTTAPALVAVFVLLLMVPGFVVGFILYLRNSLGIVSCVSEKLGVRAAMRRSKFLVADYKTRAFLLYLILFVLSAVAGVAQTFFNFFMISSHGTARVAFEISTLLVTFVTGSLVQPVGAIAFVLFYIDQRVRKEGFDVEMLLSKVTGAPLAVREMESPFGGALPGSEESPFGSVHADFPRSVPLVGQSPFSSGPLPGSFAPPARAAGDSPFSSGPLPGSRTDE